MGWNGMEEWNNGEQNRISGHGGPGRKNHGSNDTEQGKKKKKVLLSVCRLAAFENL